METQILEVGGGTQVLDAGGGTQAVGAVPQASGGESTFTGGLLRVGEEVGGCTIQSKMNTSSGEADLYIAQKGTETVVVKYYRSRLKAKDDVLAKLKSLNHANVVKLQDYGYYNERFYEVMEYADGGAVNDKDGEGAYKHLPFDEEKTVKLCRQIVEAFKACHENGIIHRDIKPANIYVRGGDFVIGDFGISSVMQADELIHKTQTASRTTGYAAPEVLSGIISPAMDYYALGITLWEVMNAKDPFTLENGQRRNDAHLIRDTIEGRMADDLLSRKPFLSEKMQRLIRGLLVIDSEHRWGYDEVTRYLNGEDIAVYVAQKNYRPLKLGEKTFTTLEELGTEIMENPDSAKRDFLRGYIIDDIEERNKEVAKQIAEVQEKASADELDLYNALVQVACILNPALPFSLDNGFKINSIEDVSRLVQTAPESIAKYILDKDSKLYAYLSAMGYKDYVQNLEKEFANIKLSELSPKQVAGNVAKAAVILNNFAIKPFPMEKYKDVELTELEQLKNLPTVLQDYVLMLVKSGSHDGLLLAWLELLSKKEFSKAENWQNLIDAIFNGKIIAEEESQPTATPQSAPRPQKAQTTSAKDEPQPQNIQGGKVSCAECGFTVDAEFMPSEWKFVDTKYYCAYCYTQKFGNKKRH